MYKSCNAVRQIFQSDLSAYIYKIQLPRHLTDIDKQRCLMFCNELSEFLVKETHIFNRVWFSDVACPWLVNA